MDYVRHGRVGLMVSHICLGAMGFGDRSWRFLGVGPRAEPCCVPGSTFTGTCDYYSAGISEEIVGALIAEHGSRNEFVVATKVGNQMGPDANARGYSRKHIIEAAERSLRWLRTDYIDLYQTHIWDPATNLEEMVEVFDHLVRSGKLMYSGITDMPFWQFAAAYLHAERHDLARFAAERPNRYFKRPAFPPAAYHTPVQNPYRATQWGFWRWPIAPASAYYAAIRKSVPHRANRPGDHRLR